MFVSVCIFQFYLWPYVPELNLIMSFNMESLLRDFKVMVKERERVREEEMFKQFEEPFA